MKQSPLLTGRCQAYLEPIRNSMQKPIEGLSVLAVPSTKRKPKKSEGIEADETIGASKP